MVQQLILAFLISVLASVGFYWKGSLSRSGIGGAIIVGSCIFGFGGWVWGFLLTIFFVSSSFLSHFKETEKQQIAAAKFDKSHQRDLGQALANGGLGALVALLHVSIPSPIWFPFFIGIISAVNADTWATELGTLSKRPPRLITSLQIVEPGTSGAISPLGTAVSLGGGLLIGFAAGLLSQDISLWIGLILGSISGLSGSLFDSFLGATVQAIYYSDYLQDKTEQKIDKGGYRTRHIRGWPWLSNDMVNAFASFVGGVTAYLLWLVLT